MANKIELYDGKYTIVNELNEGGGLYALRYGKEWRSLAGDGLVLAMFHEIERLREEIVDLRGKAHLSCPKCHEECPGWVAYGEPCGKGWAI